MRGLREHLASWSMGPMRLRDRIGAGVAGLTALSLLYQVVGLYTADRGGPYVSLSTAIDDWVPFTIEAALVYGFIYAHALVPLALLEDRRFLLRGGLAYLAIMLAGVPFWLFWTVSVPRTPLAVDGVLSWGLTVIRWFDPPTNCFPSMHVAETFLAALMVLRLDRRLGQAMMLSAAAIWWSTVALEQHWFLDGLAGLVMAVVAERAMFGGAPLGAALGLRSLPADALRAGPRARLWWLLAFYLFLFCLFAAPWWLGLIDAAALQDPW